ncbi:LrgB family protein [uncultured Campylobacter sp.]|uniref:LrgB family protein n=1 Tax=uncultured Campylobacter sp. TaxID=218934 RepID=UPI0026290E20|nr:LrgB family protein [uncultured Campylobacter sp.]
MKELLLHSSFFAVFLSLFCYQIGLIIKKRVKFAIFNPLLISIVLVIVVLIVLKIPYENYKQNSTYISYFLTPVTVCLAVPLYEQLDLLKHNYQAIFAGLIGGVIAGLGSVLLLSLLFGLNHELYVTLLPKSVTTAIGIGISEQLGGVVTISVAVIVATGILGGIMAESLFKIFRINKPIAKGIAIGCASHAIGTAKAIELGDVEGAMSSLAIAVTGLFTVVGASIFANFL